VPAHGVERRAWSAAERRENDREDRAARVAFEQELALMPAHDGLPYEDGAQTGARLLAGPMALDRVGAEAVTVHPQAAHMNLK
jgi:hypothetical protein